MLMDLLSLAGQMHSVKRRREEQKKAEKSPTPEDAGHERRFIWTLYKESGFPNRVNHAVAACKDADGDYYLYSFGGYHADDDERTVLQADTLGGPFFRSSPIDVHCLDVESRLWSKLVPPPPDKYFNTGPHTRGRIPGCRYGHTACYYKGMLYMYGGRNDEDGSFSKVECFDTTNKIWVNVMCVGDTPSSRDGHACTTIGNEMFIYGGFAASEIRFSGDLFSFNMDTHMWRMLPKVGYAVPERDFHTATAVKNRVIVFGGRSDVFAPFFTANDVYHNHFYSYDLEKLAWGRMDVTGYQPDGRRSHCAARYGSSSVIFFGGYNAVQRRHFGDLFILNTDTLHITEVRPFGDAPCPRRRVGAALVGTELIICGGTSPIKMEREGKQREILHDHNDMYILHLSPSLEQLCMMFIIKEGIDLSTLPSPLQVKIARITGKSQRSTGMAPSESG